MSVGRHLIKLTSHEEATAVVFVGHIGKFVSAAASTTDTGTSTRRQYGDGR